MTDKPRILGKIQGLLNQAASTDFDAEAQVFLAKADELMMKYQIETFELEMNARRTGGEASIPEIRNVEYMQHTDMAEFVARMAKRLAGMNGLMVADWRYGSIRVCGWPEDLDYYEMVLTSLILGLVSNMDPKYDPDRPLDENIYRMKSAGLKWDDIWIRIKLGAPYDKREISSWPRKHKKYCERTGKPYLTPTQMSGWRDDYAWGFVSIVMDRMQSVIDARSVNEAGALVLASRESDLGQWFAANVGLDFDSLMRVAQQHLSKSGKKLPATRYSQRKFNYEASLLGQKAGSQADIGLKGVN